jgi:radical SAM protein with 4Fe4S-binding SPASM domain
MKRTDIFDITALGVSYGFETHLDPLTNDLSLSSIREIAYSGIRSIVLRLDGATAEMHDQVHGVGDFEMTQAAIEFCRQVNLPFSVTTTIIRKNLQDLPLILDCVIRADASAFHPYVLIPENRKDEKRCLSEKEYEEILLWLSQQRELVPTWFGYRPTCAPQYYRVIRQQETHHTSSPADDPLQQDVTNHGCTGGRSFAYITAEGIIQMCGELTIAAGSLRSSQCDFQSIWEQSRLFQTLRSENPYSGRCRQCEYRNLCGGCRARAYIASGDYLAEEPLCAYEPGADSKNKGGDQVVPSSAA